MIMRVAIAVFVMLVLAGGARSAFADKPRFVVLPIAGASGSDVPTAATFDARFLVALEDTGHVTTVTLDEELECGTNACLVDAAKAVNAQGILQLSFVHAPSQFSVFVALFDASTARTTRRFEVTAATTDEVTTRTPVELARRLFGSPSGPAAVGIVEEGHVVGAAAAITSRLAALRTFTVAPESRPDVAFTHRAEVIVNDFSITKRRHHIHHYLDGVLVATLTITNLDTKQVVFTKPVKVTVSRRERGSSFAEVTALLADAAADEWMTAFIAAHTETLLKGDTK